MIKKFWGMVFVVILFILNLASFCFKSTGLFYDPQSCGDLHLFLDGKVFLTGLILLFSNVVLNHLMQYD